MLRDKLADKGLNLNTVFITGPRSGWKPEEDIEGFWTTRVEKDLTTYYAAADVFISNASGYSSYRGDILNRYVWPDLWPLEAGPIKC